MTNVLVIDDDSDILDLMDHALGRAGYDVRTAPSATEGLAAVATAPPSLIVVDWMMPGHSGLEVCRAVRADPRLADVTLVLLTARCSEADIEWGYAAGADDFLVKPFSPRELVRRLERVMARRQPPPDDPAIPHPPAG